MLNNQKTLVIHIANSMRGGIGTVITNSINALVSSPFQLDMLLFEDSSGKLWKRYFFLKEKVKQLSTGIIHVHGAWYLHLALFRTYSKLPIVLSPHGAFDTQSLKKSHYKKSIVKYLYMKQTYQNATCIHALTQKEANDIRRYGIKDVPIAIIPNGIPMDEEVSINHILKDRLLKKIGDKKVVLSLSRLHISKGIDILVEAFIRLHQRNPNIILFIVGKGDTTYRQQLQHKIDTAKLQQHIVLLGEMTGMDKHTLFELADIFVLPSYNEGFPLTVLEAYRQNTPVITTTATPYEEINEIGCGWYISPTVNTLFVALKEATALDKVELKKRGMLGHEWIKNHYTAEKVAKMYTMLYQWILDKQEVPYFIYEKEIRV